MRPLTPAERRQVERVKNALSLHEVDAIVVETNENTIYLARPELDASDYDTWLNIFSIILETDNVLREQWRKSYGGVKNVVE